ncbi:MAG: TFIIB-type zinc ribbon-containing protein [Thermoanaerobaculia bacterium]
MTRSVVVSTQCPNCGGPLDFSEGSNAVECAHCHSRLLVTGRKQLLSYVIDPRIGARAAQRRAVAESKASRPGEAQLWFVPYYRFVGDDLAWVRKEAPKPEEPEENRWGGNVFGFSAGDAPDALLGSGDGRTFLDFGIELISDIAHRGLGPVLDDLASAGVPKPGRKRREPLVAVAPVVAQPRRLEFELRDRHLEKNFIATSLAGAEVYSLGARTSVLKLKLLDAKNPHGGILIPPAMTPQEAFERGMRGEGGRAAFRRVVGHVMSLIYFPFWSVRVGSGAVLVDAITGKVVRRLKQGDLPTLAKAPNQHEDVARFRPLVCPNCRADLPLRPGDVIFFCGTCARAWDLRGHRLVAAEHRIVASAKPIAGKKRYLPFGIVTASADGREVRQFVPAFRYPNLRAIVEMAESMTASEAVLQDVNYDGAAVAGAAYDRDDAMHVAQFLHAGSLLQRIEDVRKLASARYEVRAATLVWMPFAARANFLRDPLCGRELFGNLI